MTVQQRSNRQANAIRKAQDLRLWEKVDGDAHTFIVDSTTTRGAYHYVTRYAADDFRCDCTAGALGLPCCHAAACWLVVNGLQHLRVTLRAATVAAPAPAVDPITRRPSGRGVGLSEGADLEDDGPSLADILAAHRAA